MKILVCGDPHLGIDTYGSPRGSATLEAFKYALRMSYDLEADFIQTGDEVDGPLSAPSLDNRTWKDVRDCIAEWFSAETGLGPTSLLVSPKGNHSLPKTKWDDYPTVWELLCHWDLGYDFGHPSSLMVLDFCPGGMEEAEKQFDEKLKGVRSPKKASYRSDSVCKYLLVVAHMLKEGTHEYDRTSTPTHENWFQDAWIPRLREKARERGFAGVRIILGHDHSPKDYPDDDLWVIGSPTPLTFGDEEPRRLLLVDTETGEVEPLPLPNFLKQKKITSMEELREYLSEENHERRIHLDIHEEMTPYEEKEFYDAIKVLSKDADVKNTSNFFAIDEDEIEKQMEHVGLIEAWCNFEDEDDVRVAGIHYLGEVSRYE